MTVLIIPTEVCKNRCKYCFERIDVRDPEDPVPLDVLAIEKTLRRMLNTPRWKGSSIGMHGGECTHLDRSSFEYLLRLQFELVGHSSIQTGGNYLQSWMVRLFKKYKTRVGISCDGPPELNVLRGPNPDNEEITKQYNNIVTKWLRRLPREGISTSVIAVLHTENVGNDDKLEMFKQWLLDLKVWGVRAGRLNPMYAAPWTKGYELSPKRLGDVYCDLFDFIIEYGLRWNPLREMVDNLLGLGLSPCTFGGCEYYPATTVAIWPDGTIGQCDRTFQEGLVPLVRPEDENGVQNRKIRSEALLQTDCKDCDYWKICRGGCPAEAIDDDWRRKSRFCDGYKIIYDHIDTRLHRMFPNIITMLDRDDVYEPLARLTWWGSTKPSHYGAAPYREGAEIFRGQLKPDRRANPGEHGDIPHGDKLHGDHTDDVGR